MLYVFSGSGAVLGSGTFTNSGSGTESDPYEIPRAESPINIDGVLEDAWLGALKLELNYEVQPGENTPAPVRTEVLLTYDSSQLYAAFRCFDPDPSAIQAHLRDRDSTGGDDWVALVLDTFNDERRSFDFVVTPLGVQMDTVETPGSSDLSWDTIWDSAGRITDEGYIVEIAIPFSSLRFQRTDGPQVWGFDAVRMYPRSHETIIGLFPRDRSNNCYLCQAVKITGFEGADPGRNIELSPTITAFRTDSRPQFPDGDLEKEREEGEAGLTARWGITPNMTANFTANPDFSQVEADAVQLDINQPFALFFPERRPFFTEGADIFRTLESVVHTRTIRDPSWGFKLTGKEGEHTVGAYVVRDDITNLIFPGSQGSRSTSLAMENTSAAFRYKKEFGARYSLGLIGTDREADDYFNRVFGFNLDFRFTRTDQIQLLVMGSSTRYPNQLANDFGQTEETINDRMISFEYDHTSRTWGWWADYEEAGAGFRMDLGFYPRVDFRNVEGGGSYRWNAPANTWWSRFTVGGEANYFEDGQGNPLLRQASGWAFLSASMRSTFFTRGWKSRQHFNGQEFDLYFYSFSVNFWPQQRLHTGIIMQFGDAIDFANTRQGSRHRFNPWFSLNAGRHIRLLFDHDFERMDVNDQHLFTTNVTQVTGVYQFNVRAYLRAIVQHVNVDFNVENYTFERDANFKRFFSQLLFSYTINPRTVLFIGYSDNYLGNQSFGLTQADRTFFVKLGYALVL